LGLKFVWAPDRSALKEVSADQLHYRFRDFNYAVRIANGVALKTASGVSISAGKQGALRLWMAQQT
ncbi:MAG: hypothetical protein HIU93_11885, partial [Acidobacteria bacterium]|nr:hypothetical protein [Acidobacteriota bacterium]MBW4046079.1 hypothetical protein [Acidobacteriota bacterium]